MPIGVYFKKNSIPFITLSTSRMVNSVKTKGFRRNTGIKPWKKGI